MRKKPQKWQALAGLAILLGLVWFIRASDMSDLSDWSDRSDTENPGEISLTLNDCIIQALKNNLDIKIEAINPRQSEVSLTLTKEKFLPGFSLNFTKRSTETASYSGLDAADQVNTEYNRYNGVITQLLPLGGKLTVTMDNDKTDTNRNFQTINPMFSSTMRFELTLPLLKNFGITTNFKEIVVARNNLKISRTRFQTMLMEIVYNVEEAYWKMVYSIENLEVQKQSLKLAQELLAKNQRLVDIGKLAPIEIKSAEAEVATREADILQAESLVQGSEDRLKTIINFDNGDLMGMQHIIPVDQPASGEKIIDLQEAVQTALQSRPDLLEWKIQLRNREIEVKYARNQMLPEVNLQASYWSPGVSGTRILYKDDDPLTKVIIGTIPGGASDAIKDVFKFLYPNWSIGLGLNIPLGTMINRTQLVSAKLGLDQAGLETRSLEQQILLDIKNAVRSVQTNYKRIQAYRLARELTEKKLTAEEEKLKVGNSTSYNVFLYQRDLSTAMSNELKAIIDYAISLAYYDRVLGITLKEKKIEYK
jgi:outer membrane protein TolC